LDRRIREWCHRFGLRGALDQNLKTFTAAIVVSDVPYTPLDRFPFDLSFGLSLGDISRLKDAWRDGLSTGQVAEPTKPRRVIPDYRQELLVRPSVTRIDRV
jgi:hypothetical protein